MMPEEHDVTKPAEPSVPDTIVERCHAVLDATQSLLSRMYPRLGAVTREPSPVPPTHI